MAARVDAVTIEGARIGFRNFRGEPDEFTPAGRRSFAIFFNDIPELAEKLREDGWAIKYTKPKEPGDEPVAFLPVRVNYNNFPPTIWMCTGRSKTLMNADTIGSLDHAEIEKVDVTFTPYFWDMRGKKGITAYVKTMYVVVHVDDLSKKYADYMDTAAGQNGYDNAFMDEEF